MRGVGWKLASSAEHARCTSILKAKLKTKVKLMASRDNKARMHNIRACMAVAGTQQDHQPSTCTAALPTFWKMVLRRELSRMMRRAANGGSRNRMYETSTEMSTKNFSHESRITASADSTRGMSAMCSRSCRGLGHDRGFGHEEILGCRFSPAAR